MTSMGRGGGEIIVWLLSKNSVEKRNYYISFQREEN